MVALLLDQEEPEQIAVANAIGMTSLICAAAGARAATLRLLLARSPPRTLLDAQDCHGRTALHFAAGQADAADATACVTALIDAGADCRRRDEQ